MPEVGNSPCCWSRQAQGKEAYSARIVTALGSQVCVLWVRLPSHVLEKNLGSRVLGVLKIESAGSAAHTPINIWSWPPVRSFVALVNSTCFWHASL